MVETILSSGAWDVFLITGVTIFVETALVIAGFKGFVGFLEFLGFTRFVGLKGIRVQKYLTQKLGLLAW